MDQAEATYVAVIGASDATDWERTTAEEVGRRLARAGAVLVCGGLGGVMDAAAAGAAAEGGTSVGILPGTDRSGASRHLTVVVTTGFGEGRNVLVARSADAMIAVGGEFGTLSEVALALKMGTRVIGLGTWDLRRDDMEADPVIRAESAEEAVRLALGGAAGPLAPTA
ncbi:MAG: TIGR00725 family protein [Actinomycetota bacterium]